MSQPAFTREIGSRSLASKTRTPNEAATGTESRKCGATTLGMQNAMMFLGGFGIGAVAAILVMLVFVKRAIAAKVERTDEMMQINRHSLDLLEERNRIGDRLVAAVEKGNSRL